MENKRTGDEKYILDVLLFGDAYSKKRMVAAIMIIENFDLLDAVRDKWGDDHYYEIVEIC
jgi:hypothetical protein